MRGLGLGLGLAKRRGGGAAPANTVLPVITGALGVGETLTGSDGTWTGAPTFAYQWERDGAAIGGATAGTHVQVTADVGTEIGFAVTATGASGARTVRAVAVGPVPSELSAGLAEYWKLNEPLGSNRDGSLGVLTLTPTGAPGSAAGVVGDAVEFVAASSQDLTCPDAPALDFTGAFSVSVWVRPATGAGTKTVVGQLGSWRVEQVDDFVQVVFGATNGYAGGVFAADTWVHVVVVFDGAGVGNANRLKIYKDGAPLALGFTGTIPATLTATASAFTVGQIGNGSGYFGGRVDELGLWNVPLSAGDVTALYAAGAGDPWPFYPSRGTRITEEGDARITEAGDTRALE